MRTPSLNTRVVAIGLGAVVTLLLGLDALLYASVRANLRNELEGKLAERAGVAQVEGTRLEPERLAARLRDLGVRATVRDADGRSYDAGPAGAPPLPLGPRSTDGLVLRRVNLPRGSTAVVAFPRAGMEADLRRLLALEAALTLLGAALATFMLRWISEVALRPLEQVVAAARRTAAGQRGERLRPDRSDTRLGELATAYDEMLDSLESALADARVAQARSQRLQEHAQQILETAGDAYVAIDASGAIVSWNAAAERTFGWPRTEVLDRPMAETIIPHSLRPAHQEGFERYLATGVGPILGRRVEMTALHRDGHVFPVELNVWATQHGGSYAFNAFVHDITDRRRAEAATARLASIVEWSDAAILSSTLDGTILTWNRGAERMYGWTAEEAVGRSNSLIVPPERHAEVVGFLEQVGQGHAVAYVETVRRRKDGSTVEVALTISPIRDHTGAVVAASAITRDLSEKRRMEAELESTLADLEVALAESRDSEERTRRFLADAAHQLRTPIAGIQACAEALLRHPPAEDVERLLCDIVDETSRASRQMTALLQMARVSQGQPLAPRPVDLVALCDDEADRARSLAPDLDIDLRVERAPGKAEVDPEAVREVLANLLDNARRHADHHIEIQVGAEGDTVDVRVVDDGPGLPEALSERVFDRFVSLDGQGGTGLGLPIARGLARAHGGDLSYEGKAFVLRLPVRTEVVSRTARTPARATSGTDGRGDAP